MKKMPVLFIGHGSPMNMLDKENPFNQNFSLITQKFAKPIIGKDEIKSVSLECKRFEQKMRMYLKSFKI